MSITRSADQPAAAAPAASHKAAAAAAEPEPAAADPGPGIKEEPAEVSSIVITFLDPTGSLAFTLLVS